MSRARDSPILTDIYISSSVVREINKINQRELDLGISGSWHDDYKGERQLTRRAGYCSLTFSLDSAYIFVGGLNPELTEGDVISIFSQ